MAGILILYMVFTHICQHFNMTESSLYSMLERFFYFFMPWFFFKSGYYFKLTSNQVQLQKGVVKFVKPFFFYSLIGQAIYCVHSYCTGTFEWNMLYPVREFLGQGSVYGNLPLWFLLTLFLSRLVYNYLANHGIRNEIIGFVALSFAFGLHLFEVDKPYILANTCSGVFFMSLGYIMKNYMSKLAPPILFLLCLIYALSVQYPSFVGMRSNHLYYGYYLLWIIYSICAIVVWNKVSQYMPFQKIGFHIVGKYSMQIYCIHWIPLMFI